MGRKLQDMQTKAWPKITSSNPEQIVWSEAIPDLNISENFGWFCAGFAQNCNEKGDQAAKCLIPLQNMVGTE